MLLIMYWNRCIFSNNQIIKPIYGVLIKNKLALIDNQTKSFMLLHVASSDGSSLSKSQDIVNYLHKYKIYYLI